MSMQTSFTGAPTPNMLAVGKQIPGPNAQIASSFVVRQNSLGVQSRSTPESKAIEKEVEFFEFEFFEFDFEEEVIMTFVSQCVERCPKIEETVKEKTVKEDHLYRSRLWSQLAHVSWPHHLHLALSSGTGRDQACPPDPCATSAACS